MNYSLRNTRLDELEWLYTLNKESFLDVVVRQFGEWDETFQRQLFFSKWDQPRPAQVIETGTDRVGVVILEQLEDCNWLHELQIWPDYQRLGLGTTLLNNLLADARARGVPLRLQVLHANQDAKRLYERLGFAEIDKLDHHYLMEIV
ncbi:N-acetyltransferase [Marinobacter sp. 1_MG-2023]|uniref:GNAT family N-acetyltransferase n=1 Tax=Marinobacter sp. 1_MG-2023 TaxID=3062627 RepID=UPI0026E1F1C9|nr:GNAT family N-acetyltransferase [Marinobacter sp. 1_MG-2023]MDO6825028.1 GNAT family N-acetyltransferase [Marinobacter sp. 1_MG-2023]